jgi:S-adenosylmethionine/arginine decarboxylase-like enzyme
MKNIVLDFFDCKSSRVTTERDLKNYLGWISKALNLTPYGEPQMTGFPIEDGYAWTGSMVLGESLISFHTYPEHKAIYIDLFTCSDFDGDKFLDDSMLYFKPMKYYLTNIKRQELPIV